jgi:glutamate-5-semialdehyde dehydrogenase
VVLVLNLVSATICKKLKKRVKQQLHNYCFAVIKKTVMSDKHNLKHFNNFDITNTPMIKHLEGICHIYIDADADITMAVKVCDNAKTQRYSPCNAMETLLVNKDVAQKVLPTLCKIYQDKGVELRVDGLTRKILESNGFQNLVDATEEDWHTEYLAPILSIKTVSDIEEAMNHIERYGSKHTDAIITNNKAQADRFLREVDSASVMVNASTRFADGFEYGLGAEIGISNDKLHARGPVGLEGLTSLKYIVMGHGEIRS